MVGLSRSVWVFVLAGITATAWGQEVTESRPRTASGTASDSAAIAARVNNQAVSEIAVERGLRRVPEQKRAQARPDILDYLIDNLLIDQYLQQIGQTVDKKDVEAKVKQIHEEIAKGHQEFDKVMKDLMLTEAELRTNIEQELRWNHFAEKQATEERLKKFFESEKEMFDGTVVRARHILLNADAGSTGGEKEMTKLAAIKKKIENEVDQGLGKLPADGDKLVREKTRQELMAKAFADMAKAHSQCTATKDQGGDVSWFPRGGSMVEPFAKAAFALKPYEMSDPVHTQFGYHLILVTDRKSGREVTYDEVKEEVMEVYCARLRDRVIAKVRPTAKISITPVKSKDTVEKTGVKSQ